MGSVSCACDKQVDKRSSANTACGGDGMQSALHPWNHEGWKSPPRSSSPTPAHPTASLSAPWAPFPGISRDGDLPPLCAACVNPLQRFQRFFCPVFQPEPLPWSSLRPSPLTLLGEEIDPLLTTTSIQLMLSQLWPLSEGFPLKGAQVGGTSHPTGVC